MTDSPYHGRGASRGLLYGLVVESPSPLPWSGPVRAGEPDLFLEVLPPAAPSPAPVPLSEQIPGPGGEPWLSTARLPGGGLFLRFAGSADFKVNGTGSRILCRPLEGLSPAEAVDLFAEGVVPFLLDHRGDTVVHAGAVALPGGAAAILGVSGAGKSTLTAALGLAGHPLLGDDVLVLRRRGAEIEALPGLRRVDLHAESLRLAGLDRLADREEDGGKVRILESDRVFEFAEVGTPLRAIFLLEPDGPAAPGSDSRGESDVSLGAPLRATDAVAVLADHLFRADRQDGARYASELERLCALAETAPVRRVRGHRGAERLQAVVKALVNACTPAAAAGTAP